MTTRGKGLYKYPQICTKNGLYEVKSVNGGVQTFSPIWTLILTFTVVSSHMGDQSCIIFYCCDGVRLCLCGTAAANGPIVHPPDDT
jgi:hypothetical protein